MDIYIYVLNIIYIYIINYTYTSICCRCNVYSCSKSHTLQPVSGVMFSDAGVGECGNVNVECSGDFTCAQRSFSGKARVLMAVLHRFCECHLRLKCRWDCYGRQNWEPWWYILPGFFVELFKLSSGNQTWDYRRYPTYASYARSGHVLMQESSIHREVCPPMARSLRQQRQQPTADGWWVKGWSFGVLLWRDTLINQRLPSKRIWSKLGDVDVYDVLQDVLQDVW